MKVRKIREVSWRGEVFEKGRIGKSTDTSSVVDPDPNWIRIQQLCESGFVFQVGTDPGAIISFRVFKKISLVELFLLVFFKIYKKTLGSGSKLGQNSGSKFNAFGFTTLETRTGKYL